LDLNIAHLLIWYVVFVFSITFHEFAHAYLAYRGGDLTGHQVGVVSLDPVPHIRRSPFGLLVIPLLSYAFNGWMIGWASVPYSPDWARRNPKKQALMSLAGPLANFSLAFAAFVALKLLLAAGLVMATRTPSFTGLVALPEGADSSSLLGATVMALSILLNLNVLLGVFNLIPVPPLDGAGVVQGFFPKGAGRLIDWFEQVPMAGFVGLLLAWRIMGVIVGPLFFRVFSLF
jgi:Zn-dependent protease